jgi:hypothetical protein
MRRSPDGQWCRDDRGRVPRGSWDHEEGPAAGLERMHSGRSPLAEPLLSPSPLCCRPPPPPCPQLFSMSAPEEGNGVAAPIPIPAVAVPRRSPTPRDADGRALPSGLPPASPAHGTPRSSRRAADAGRRSMDAGGRRSMEGGRRGQRHAVEVPEGAVPREGLVVSRQEKVRCNACQRTALL